MLSTGSTERSSHVGTREEHLLLISIRQARIHDQLTLDSATWLQTALPYARGIVVRFRRFVPPFTVRHAVKNQNTSDRWLRMSSIATDGPAVWRRWGVTPRAHLLWQKTAAAEIWPVQPRIGCVRRLARARVPRVASAPRRSRWRPRPRGPSPTSALEIGTVACPTSRYAAPAPLPSRPSRHQRRGGRRRGRRRCLDRPQDRHPWASPGRSRGGDPGPGHRGGPSRP